MEMRFKLISPEGPEYDAERMLRWEVLSKPLGIPPETELPEEQHSLHLVAMTGKRLVGCVCFHPESESHGLLFEMAISQEYHGQGFGRQLLHTFEQMLAERGIKDVYLYSSPDSEEFYTLMGYQPQEDVVMKRGVPQRKMKKAIHSQEA